MLSHTRTLMIEWGDCDPAGIVFYTRYFAMFDASTAALFSHALGIRKAQMLAKYGIGLATRVWVGRHPEDPTVIKAQPIPAEVIGCFSGNEGSSE